MTDRLTKLVKHLNEPRNGTALVQLMEWADVNNLQSVSNEQAEIFYFLYHNIIKTYGKAEII
jgi:hypothetical protein